MPQSHSTEQEEIPVLTNERLLSLGSSVVPFSMIPAVWQGITGREVTKDAALQARRNGRIHPMGKNGNRLYFWRHEVEAAARKTNRGRKSKDK